MAINLLDEGAFLIGVALDSADRKVLADALDYRHGGKAPAGLYEEVMRGYNNISAKLPDDFRAAPPIYFNTPN